MNKLVARLNELLSQLQTEDRYKSNGGSITEGAERQKQQLWKNIIKDTVEDEPYAKWLTQGKWQLTELPDTKTVEKLLQTARKRVEETDKDTEKEKRLREKNARRYEKRGSGCPQSRQGGSRSQKRVRATNAHGPNRGWNNIETL